MKFDVKKGKSLRVSIILYPRGEYILYQFWVMTPRMNSGSGLVVTHTIDLPKTLNV